MFMDAVVMYHSRTETGSRRDKQRDHHMWQTTEKYWCVCVCVCVAVPALSSIPPLFFFPTSTLISPLACVFVCVRPSANPYPPPTTPSLFYCIFFTNACMRRHGVPLFTGGGDGEAHHHTHANKSKNNEKNKRHREHSTPRSLCTVALSPATCTFLPFFSVAQDVCACACACVCAKTESIHMNTMVSLTVLTFLALKRDGGRGGG